MKIVYPIFFVFTLSIAHTPDTLWTKRYGGEGMDFGSDITQTIDQGYFVVGATQLYGSGGLDVWLLRTDTSGGALGTKTYGQIG
jgi:hypothetical protein